MLDPVRIVAVPLSRSSSTGVSAHFFRQRVPRNSERFFCRLSQRRSWQSSAWR